mmetsp:Transcript_1308/g.2859  ORF Transcript_1308/g.2859 Transcript_1308/m.2859 type:complete len:590 (-) Transcript_1308:54-1823(-)
MRGQGRRRAPVALVSIAVALLPSCTALLATPACFGVGPRLAFARGGAGVSPPLCKGPTRRGPQVSMAAGAQKEGLDREVNFWLWSAVPEASWLHNREQQELLLGTSGMALSSKDPKDALEASVRASSLFNTPRTRRLYPVVIALAAVSQGLLFGFALGYTSPALAPLSRELALTTLEASTFAALINIGAMVAGVFGGRALESKGRKSCLVASSVLFTVGFAGVAKAESFALLLTSRLITGIAAGLCTVAAPVYVAETAPKNLRGTLGTFFQLSVTVGILVAYAVGATQGWRELAKWGAGVAMASGLLAMQLLPESPTWLMSQGRKGDAGGVLQKLSASEKDARDEASSLSTPSDGADAAKGSSVSLSSLTKGEMGRGVSIAVCLMAMQQFSGINAVIFFSGGILSRAGFGAVANQAAVYIALAQVVCTGLAATLVDKLGRRTLLAASGVGMSAGLGLLATYFWLQGTVATAGFVGALAGAGPMLAAAGLALFISSFAFGWGPVPWLMVGELFPVEARGMASGLATVVNWGGSTLVTQSFAIVLMLLGPTALFLTYAVFCAVSVVWVLSPQFVETKGKSLAQIQKDLKAA